MWYLECLLFWINVTETIRIVALEVNCGGLTGAQTRDLIDDLPYLNNRFDPL